MASLSELIVKYNEAAIAQNLPTRKKFRDHADAARSLEKLGLSSVEKPQQLKKPKKTNSKSEDYSDDRAVVEFHARPGTKQYLVLHRLLEAQGQPVPISELAHIAQVSVDSAGSIVNGIIKKTKGELLGKSKDRPKYRVEKSRIEKELNIALQAE